MMRLFKLASGMWTSGTTGGRIHINWIPTDTMPADGLTKALSSDQHGRFIQQLGLVDAEHLIG
jgi:hypothetical protein